MPKYDWVPFYEELAKALYFNNTFNGETWQQKVLFSDPLLSKIQYCNEFVIFELLQRHSDRRDIDFLLNKLKEIFELKADVPTSTLGLPMISISSRFLEHQAHYLSNIYKAAMLYVYADQKVSVLHNTAEKALQDTLRYSQTKPNEADLLQTLSIGLYWIAPQRFLCLTPPVISYLKQYLSKSKVRRVYYPPTNFEQYDALMEDLLASFKEESSEVKSFVELCDKAYEPYRYDKNRFLSEVHMSESMYDQLVSLIQSRKNIILQGVIGAGKTFIVERLASSIVGQTNSDRVCMIQMHSNYSYNAFMGKDGIFRTFCEQAAETPWLDHYFIIDDMECIDPERVFGEALSLLACSRRNQQNAITLIDNQKFYIPANVHVIATMNLTDNRGSINYALRRTFAVFPLAPSFETDSFIAYQKSLKNEAFDLLVDRLKTFNVTRYALQDCIGPSYLYGLNDQTDLPAKLYEIVEYDIIPHLRACDNGEAWIESIRNAIL